MRDRARSFRKKISISFSLSYLLSYLPLLSYKYEAPNRHSRISPASQKCTALLLVHKLLCTNLADTVPQHHSRGFVALRRYHSCMRLCLLQFLSSRHFVCGQHQSLSHTNCSKELPHLKNLMRQKGKGLGNAPFRANLMPSNYRHSCRKLLTWSL